MPDPERSLTMQPGCIRLYHPALDDPAYVPGGAACAVKVGDTAAIPAAGRFCVTDRPAPVCTCGAFRLRWPPA